MDANVGGRDRTLRTIVAVSLLAVGYLNRDRTIGTMAFLAGSDLFATAVIQRCPLNTLFGVDTCPGA